MRDWFTKILEAVPYITGTIGIFSFDNHIKNKIETNKKEGTYEEIAGGKLILGRLHNKGAFLQLGEKHTWLIKGISLILTLVLTILFTITLTRAGAHLLKTGCTLLLGGAFSNTYDRLKRGYVVDYVRFNVSNSKLRNIVFNVSDFCIMIGAVLITVSSMNK